MSAQYVSSPRKSSVGSPPCRASFSALRTIGIPSQGRAGIGGMGIGRTPFTTKLPPGIYKAAFSVAGYSN